MSGRGKEAFELSLKQGRKKGRPTGFVSRQFLEVEIDGGAADGDQSSKVVVLAAEGFLVAGSSRASSTHSERCAMGSDEDSKILDHDAQQAEEDGDRTTIGVTITLAANSGTSVALPGRGGRFSGPFGRVHLGRRKLSGREGAQSTGEPFGIGAGSSRDEGDEGEEEEAERGELHHV